MRKVVLRLAVAALMSGCVVVPGPPAYEVEVAPPLPAVVVLHSEPYYYHRGYYYHYYDNGWSYSRHNGGPWRELPRSHWPHEVRQERHRR